MQSLIDYYTHPSVRPELAQESTVKLRLMGNFLEAFACERYAEGVSKAIFTLFDATFETLETLIMINRNGQMPQLKYEFGWIDANGQARSSGLITGTIVTFQPSWTYQGVRLNFEVVEELIDVISRERIKLQESSLDTNGAPCGFQRRFTFGNATMDAVPGIS